MHHKAYLPKTHTAAEIDWDRAFSQLAQIKMIFIPPLLLLKGWYDEIHQKSPEPLPITVVI